MFSKCICILAASKANELIVQGRYLLAFHAANKKANQVGYEFFDLYSFDIENTLDSVAYEEPSACSLLIVIPMEALLPTF